jgi:membrane fusion protein (multidrug efflux system)
MSNNSSSPKSKNWMGRNRRVLLIGGPVLFLLVALAFYMLTGRYVSTDDAYIQVARVDISTEISGRIGEIDVHDNQLVRKGQVLFRLNSPRFRIAVADAKAQLAAAELKVATLKAEYRQRLADESAARSALAFADREFED